MMRYIIDDEHDISEVAGDIQYCSACEIGNAAKSDFCPPHCGAIMDGWRCRQCD